MCLCVGAEGETSLLQEKPKKKTRKSRKGKLEESFPGYLQVWAHSVVVGVGMCVHMGVCVGCVGVYVWVVSICV